MPFAARETLRNLTAPFLPMLCSRRLPFVLSLLLLPAIVLAREAKEQARIDFLLRTVEMSEDLTFIRNGKAHDAQDAASHLRRKLEHAGERIQTAEQFIKHAATESSMTGRNYRIRLGDGSTVDAGDYLTKQLREFDARKR